MIIDKLIYLSEMTYINGEGETSVSRWLGVDPEPVVDLSVALH